MAIVVRLDDKSNTWECANRVAHITVGTRDNTVKPKESNDLLAKWLDDGVSPGSKLREVVFADKVTIGCEVHPVLSR